MVVHADRILGCTAVLAILFMFLVYRELEHGPARDKQGAADDSGTGSRVRSLIK